MLLKRLQLRAEYMFPKYSFTSDFTKYSCCQCRSTRHINICLGGQDDKTKPMNSVISIPPYIGLQLYPKYCIQQTVAKVYSSPLSINSPVGIIRISQALVKRTHVSLRFCPWRRDIEKVTVAELSKKMTCLLRNRKLLYSVHKSLRLDLTLSHMNIIHTLTTLFL